MNENWFDTFLLIVQDESIGGIHTTGDINRAWKFRRDNMTRQDTTTSPRYEEDLSDVSGCNRL